MASSRLKDDTCAYQKALKQSVDPLAYQLDPTKYIHGRRCMMKLGTLGGNAVSTLAGQELVDTENELFNITRPASNCPLNKYVPARDGFDGLKKKHLGACQIVNYKAVPGAVWVPPSI